MAHAALLDLLEVPGESNENLHSFQFTDRCVNRRYFPLLSLPPGLDDMQEEFEEGLLEHLPERVLFRLRECPAGDVHIFQKVVHCSEDGSVGDERHL